MTLDIRVPVGLLFTIFGLLLVWHGIANESASIAGGMNVNAEWGAVLIVFGVGMLLLARRRALRMRRGAG
jgi:hypothetical protein